MDEIKGLKEKNLVRTLLLLVIPIFLIVLIWFGWVIKDRILPPEKIHLHAGFIVVANNQIVDFTGYKYMHVKPCSGETDEKLTSIEEQLMRAHLHDGVGNVVHIHRKNVKWMEVFTNLEYQINYPETITYLNGDQINNFQNRVIKPHESLVLFVGKDNDVNKFLPQAVTVDQIKIEEAKKESCGS